MQKPPGPSSVRVRSSDPLAPDRLAHAVRGELRNFGWRPGRSATVICIGTDRSTGDALGPIVGTLLAEKLAAPHVRIVGTLDSPVHAVNLDEAAQHLKDAKGPVVAVDACLGTQHNVGTVLVQRGSIRPGAGVRKQLHPVGDVAVTATVNVGGFMEYVVLQNTRLAVVYGLARVIADGLAFTFSSRLVSDLGLSAAAEHPQPSSPPR